MSQILSTSTLSESPNAFRAGSSKNIPSLTSTEFKLINCIVEGKTQSEAAKTIYVSLKYAEKVLDQMRLKYNCRNTIQLIYFLTANNLI